MTLKPDHFDRSRSKAWGREAAALVVSAVFFSVTALHAAERAPVCEAEKNFNNQQLVWTDDYADMPYLVKLPDGRLGMTITVGADREGASEQHVVWLSSRDNGATWSEPISLEPPGGPEASWAMPFVKDSRLYVVYAYNTRNRRAWPLSDGGARTRVDMLGDMALRYSDDGGETWSERIIVALPRTAIDDENGFEGQETIFWMSGAPVIVGDEVMLGISKGGRSYSSDILPDTEGFLMAAKTPEDPSSWHLLPEGDRGFRAINGDDVTEEPSLTITTDGHLLVVMRTTSGKILQATRRGEEEFQLSWAKHTGGLKRFAIEFSGAAR